MRRQRFQKGSVHLRKHGRHRVWIAQWWENGGKRSKVLGNYPSIVKGQAEEMLSQLLAPMNQTAGHRQIPIYTFQQYVESVFLPAMRGKWKESTRSTSEPDIIRYLVPAFGQLVVHMISREQMQKFLHEKASQLSESIVGHLRWHLNAIYSMAQSDGLVEFNPAGALFTPACRPGPEKRVLVGSEVRMALRLLGLRERLIFRMAVFDGMRPGEIFAIQLGRIDETSVRIHRRIYDGNVDSPKGRKGKNTSRTVALSQGTLADLDIWRRLLQDQADDAYLFPSETGTTPPSTK